MICRNCGTMNKEEAKFCECCGQDLNSPYINPTVVEEKPKTSNNVISMVMGILSIVLSCSGIVSLVLGIVAVVLARKERKNGNDDGMLQAGFVCGVIGIVMSCLYFIFVIIYIVCVGLIAISEVACL